MIFDTVFSPLTDTVTVSVGHNEGRPFDSKGEKKKPGAHKLSHSAVHMESIKADDSRPSASLCFVLTLSCFPEEGDYRFQIVVVSHSVLTCPETFPRVPPYLTRPQRDLGWTAKVSYCHVHTTIRSSLSDLAPDPHAWSGTSPGTCSSYATSLYCKSQCFIHDMPQNSTPETPSKDDKSCL